MQESGIFTWDLGSNTVYADSALASLFGLDRRDAEQGLPIESFLERMHDDDRPGIAKLIHESIVTGMPYQGEYRVLDSSQKFASVTAFGRCFRDETGNPSHYAGIVFPADDKAGHTDSTLVWHCLSAYELAQAAGNQPVAKLMLMALSELKH